MAEDAIFDSSSADLDVSKETTKNDEVGEVTNIVKSKEKKMKKEVTEQATKQAEENDDNSVQKEPDDDEMNFSLRMKKKKETTKEAEENDDNSAKEEQPDDDEMNFSLPLKKKKKKKPEENKIEKDADREYTYDELLTRAFDTMQDKNPYAVTLEKRKFRVISPDVFKIGTKKTCFANFGDICKNLHSQLKHLLAFLLAELGTSGSIDSNNQLIIKGRFQQKQIESALSIFIEEYVTFFVQK